MKEEEIKKRLTDLRDKNKSEIEEHEKRKNSFRDLFSRIKKICKDKDLAVDVYFYGSREIIIEVNKKFLRKNKFFDILSQSENTLLRIKPTKQNSISSIFPKEFRVSAEISHFLFLESILKEEEFNLYFKDFQYSKRPYDAVPLIECQTIQTDEENSILLFLDQLYKNLLFYKTKF